MLAPAACGPDIDLAKSLDDHRRHLGVLRRRPEGRLELPAAQPHVPARQLGVRRASPASSSPSRTGGTARTASGIPSLVQRIGNDTIPANGTSDPVTVRGTVSAITLEEPAPICSHIVCSRTSRRRSSRAAAAASIRIGSVKLDHQIIPHVKSGSPVKAPVASAPAASPEAATLARRLGPYDAATIVISNVIGGGIFFIPVMVAGPGADAAGRCWASGWWAACSRSRARWRTPSSRRCGRTRAANTSTCARRSARSPRFSPAGRRSSRDSRAPSPRAPSRSPSTSAGSSRRPPTRRRSRRCRCRTCRSS